MNGKKMALILGLVALVIAIPAGYVLAHPGGYYYDEVRAEQYRDEDWYQEMEQYMQERWENQDYGRYGYGGFGGCHRWGW